MMYLAVRDSRRLTIRLAAVSLLASLALALPATARGADGPRFLLVTTPHGAIVHARPNGRVIAQLPGSTPLGTPTWLWITATTPGGRWGHVILPIRPNGLTGWIDLRGLAVRHTATWIRASLGERRIWLMHGRMPIASYPVAIGAPDTSTPIGRFSVTDRVPTGDPSGPFGWYAFGLSGHQPNLPPSWAGGDQLAIHGTNDPASIGRPASHGCLRVSAAALARLREALALGTPVVIMQTRAAATRSAIAASLPRLQPPRRPSAGHRHPPVATAPPIARASRAEVLPRAVRRWMGWMLASPVAVAPAWMPLAVLPRASGRPARATGAHDRTVPVVGPRISSHPAIRRPVPGSGRAPPRAPPHYPGSGRSA